MKLRRLFSTMMLCLVGVQWSWAQSVDERGPKAIPQDRESMLKALDDLKYRSPRLPFIELEADEPTSRATAGSLGTLGVVNNARLRRMHLPAELQGSSNRGSDPAMKLPNDFAVELFWIASRVNNCHYCLGHQESKLKRAGLTEDQLLWLDTDWQRFSPRERAGFEFAKTLTHAPHMITAQQIEDLKEHFAPLEILEMAYLVGRYNATNRWTDSLGIPQEEERDYTSTLVMGDLKAKSIVAPPMSERRPIPPDLGSWLSQLEAAKHRSSRLPLVELTTETAEPVEPHAALMLNFPVTGKQWLEQLATADSQGQLPTELRASILFVCAVEDNAWYVQQLARQQLLAQGWTDEQVFGLVTKSQDSSTDAALSFARKLTSQPQAMTDGDIEKLKVHFTSSQIAEIVYRVGLAAHLDRFTETAGLGWN